METHKRYIDYAITMISSLGFYVSNTSVSTTFTSIIHINFNGEQNGYPRGSDDGAGWRRFPGARRRGSVTMISLSSLEMSWQWRGCGGAAQQRSHMGTTEWIGNHDFWIAIGTSWRWRCRGFVVAHPSMVVRWGRNGAPSRWRRSRGGV
jgi:hypothetical protein